LFGLLETGRNPAQIELSRRSISGIVRIQGTFSNRYARRHEFPQVFAQVWKSLGGDQIPWATSAVACNAKTATVA
jgi:hypothetical protein